MSQENKFNFSEEETEANSSSNANESKKAIKKDAHGLLISIKAFLIELHFLILLQLFFRVHFVEIQTMIL